MKRNKKIIFLIIILIFVGSFSFIIYKNSKESEFTKFVLSSEVVNTIKPKDNYKEEITSLQEEYNNNDIVGILEIEGTDYKVPIVQGTDNTFYLKHLPNREYSIMGSIFLDYRVNINASHKLLIYGHNSSTYDMPFKILENYYDEEFMKNHPYVNIKTKNQVRRYEIFSLYIATSDYKYMDVNFTNDEYQEHVKYLQEKSLVNIESNLIVM